MDIEQHRDEVEAIKAVIARQFASLNWGPGKSADWVTFAADFFPGATLYPAARPAKSQAVQGFIERMKALSGTKLRSFREEVLGHEVHIFSNVAVAVAVCGMTENETELNRGIEMMLLIKDEGAWRIVSQVWDVESPSKPIPAHLLVTTGSN